MKKILIGIIFLFGVNLSGFSQANPEQRVQKLIENLEEKTELSKEKQDGLKEIYTEFFNSMREAGRGDRAKMQILIKERDQKVEKLLNEQEFLVYKEILEKQATAARRPNNGN